MLPIPSRKPTDRIDQAKDPTKEQTIKKRPKSMKGKKLVKCPTGCTQYRTLRDKLTEKETYDPASDTCYNCGFSRGRKEKPDIMKASKLKKSGYTTN